MSDEYIDLAEIEPSLTEDENEIDTILAYEFDGLEDGNEEIL